MSGSLNEIGDRVNDFGLGGEVFWLVDVVGFGESKRHFATLDFSFGSRMNEAEVFGFDGVFSFTF